MTDPKFPVNLEVKCAICGSYFPLDQVTKYKNGYYCRYCYPYRHEQQHKGPVKGIDASRNHGEAVDGTAKTGNRCAACGRVLMPDDSKVVDGKKSYCPVCYNKIILASNDDEAGKMRTFIEARCASCDSPLDLFDVDHRRIHDGKRYCERCYEKIRDSPGNRRFFLAEQAGINLRPGVTTVKDAASIVECTNCGWVITRDRIETFTKDPRGRLRCPRCGKKFTPPESRAPVNTKPEKSKPEKPGIEDFAATAQLFKCLGDPCRVKIIESLSEKELCVFEFVDLTGFQYSAISYHLKMLKDLGLIQSYERGNFMVYSLTDKGQIVHEFIEKSKGLS